MKFRSSLAAVIISALASYPATASVLSASSQAVRTPAVDRTDYLRVTHVQDDLNASMREMVDASTASAPLSSPLPSVDGGDGGFVVQKDGNGGGGGGGRTGLDIGSLVGAGTIGRDVDRLSVRSGGIGTFGADGSSGSHGGGRRGGGGGGHGGGPHASPEPSTWMLLGAGLGLLGGYAVLRRRQTVAV